MFSRPCCNLSALPTCLMPRKHLLLVAILAIAWNESVAAAKPHVVTFGKWVSAKLPDANGKRMLDLKVRALLVDTRVREYTTGSPHEVTDRLFVVRRAFRINDALPGENFARWQWQLGGWLLVDRLTGRVSQLRLPEFDPFYSIATWYRDYVAYCGVSDDGKKLYAMVVQIGLRKPILKKDVGEPDGDDAPGLKCPPPIWERSPARVTFRPDGKQRVVFSIRSRAVDTVNEPEESEEPE